MKQSREHRQEMITRWLEWENRVNGGFLLIDPTEGIYSFEFAVIGGMADTESTFSLRQALALTYLQDEENQ